MSLQTLRSCLANIDVKVRLLRLFNFGEALLHPRFVETVELVYKWGGYEKLEVSTNGQCDPEKLIGISKIDRIVVSCDGEGTKEDYERIRTGASWERLINFLRRVKDIAPYSEHLIRGIVDTSEGRERWRSIAKGWNFSFREWLPFPRSTHNPSGITAHKSKGSCEHMDTDNLYVDCHGNVGPCCNYPNAFIIGTLSLEKASALVKKKRQLRKEIKVKRLGVCRECAF